MRSPEIIDHWSSNIHTLIRVYDHTLMYFLINYNHSFSLNTNFLIAMMMMVEMYWEAFECQKCSFFEHCSNGGGGGGGQPMFKNYVGNCRVFWRSFNNMKFAWKGTFEALMVKFGGEIGTLYQIFTPCTPLPKYKRAFTWFLGGSNSLPGCRRIFYRGLP